MNVVNRKVVIIGTGMVGMSYAYALLNQNACDELALIDINKERCKGEAMDLNHGLAFSGSNMKIYAGCYSDCKDADLVVLCAGVSQKPGETRLDLLKRNAKVFESIINPVVESGFNGIFLVATNPVDIMTRITKTLSGFPSSRVMGSGTTLDTARLKYILGRKFEVDPRNVHAYVIGEHGDSEFVAWSQSGVATKRIFDISTADGGYLTYRDMETIEHSVRDAASEIIGAKGATYYGIGMALVRITKAIFGNEHSVITVSSCIGEGHSYEGVYIGMPAIVCGSGIKEVLYLSLNQEERSKYRSSCKLLDDYFKDLGLEEKHEDAPKSENATKSKGKEA